MIGSNYSDILRGDPVEVKASCSNDYALGGSFKFNNKHIFGAAALSVGLFAGRHRVIRPLIKLAGHAWSRVALRSDKIESLHPRYAAAKKTFNSERLVSKYKNLFLHNLERLKFIATGSNVEEETLNKVAFLTQKKGASYFFPNGLWEKNALANEHFSDALKSRGNGMLLCPTMNGIPPHLKGVIPEFLKLNEGACAGMSHVMAVRCLKFWEENPGENPEKVLMSTAEEFRLGANFAALELQASAVYHDENVEYFSIKDSSMIESPFCKGGLVEVDNKLNAMKDGGYLIASIVSRLLDVGHLTFMVKSGRFFYYFDPNMGFMKIDRENWDQYLFFLGTITDLWYGGRPLIESLDPDLKGEVRFVPCVNSSSEKKSSWQRFSQEELDFFRESFEDPCLDN
ncbi:MAG: hypothetical protein ACOYK9_03865 [Chlamydiia bacterium]